MKQLSILGSTGSIGTNVLKIVEMFPQRFEVKALAAKHNVELLANQIERFHPEIAAVFDRERAIELKGILPPYNGTQILFGIDGYKAAAAHDNVDQVVSAMVGAAGLIPTLTAIEAGEKGGPGGQENPLIGGGKTFLRGGGKKGGKFSLKKGAQGKIYINFRQRKRGHG
nr:hypothetical protein [Deltaproteobacteria bacterium]